MRHLLVLIAALGALVAFAPAASAQTGPDAGLNEFFFHGPEGDKAGITSKPPAPGGGQRQTKTSLGNAETPDDSLVIRWQGTEQTGIADGKEVVFRWYFSSPNAGGLLIGVGVNIRILAVAADNKARVIGKVDDANLIVGTQPTINETVVKATGAVADGERLFVQVDPRFLDTGQGLTAHYDSASTASGFSLRDPTPETSSNPGIDGLPSADPQGLAFSATVPADPQRDESEPNIEIDGDGNIYTCGPTGIASAAEYAQVSFDGGNQFRLIGEDPRGQQSFGGGGDCGFATSPVRNAKGLFNYAYSGLGPLTNFATAASSDNGRTLRAAQTVSIPGVDRQWHTFLDEDTVLLSYNQQAPRQVVVQRSEDGGVNYGPPVAATSTNPSFPGPMHSLPAEQNPAGAKAGRVAYFGWNRGAQIFLAASLDNGRTWRNCKIAKAPGAPGLFTTVDNDRAGNIYVAYSERTTFHTYVSVLPIDKLSTCTAKGSEVNPLSGQQSASTEVQAEVNAPIQVDRDRVRTSLFSWVAAGGAPGRFAVTFYGSETDGDPNVGPGMRDGKPTGFRGSWDVYVSQSLDALAPKPAVAQVKATTHPFHYDSICLNGLGCSITLGDRSLADFFAMDFNPKRHALSLVYNQGYKRPDDAGGVLATPAVINQIAGPTLDGEPIDAAQGPPLDNRKDDPEGDALADFSKLCLETDAACTPGSGRAEPGADLRSIRVGPETDPKTGAPVANGGFDVTMQVADLSNAKLQQALNDQRATSLLFIFRWINGFRSSAAVAKYDPVRGFRFGFNDFVTGSVSCGSTRSKCIAYPGDQAVPGKVDQKTGTITISVPRSKLKALSGSTGADERPKLVDAAEGSRFYDGTAFVLAATAPTDTNEQSFLYPFDNTPAFDFLTGGALPPAADGGGRPPTDRRPPVTPPGGGGGGGGAVACQSSAGFASVSARRAGRTGVRLGFARRVTAPVNVDVFRVSEGRRVVRERLVARFTGRSESFTWNGVSNRGDGKRKRVGSGYYFVRYTMVRGGRRFDVRRIVLRRAGGRFSRRPDYYRRDTCDLLNKFKLERPVFGGPRANTLKVAYRMSSASRVSVTVLKGSKVVKRYAPVDRAARRTYRLTLPARKRARGDYRIRLEGVSNRDRVTSTLTARRL